VLSLNTSVAQDKKKPVCELCAQVNVVLESARCEKCKPDKQCEKCAAHVKDLEKKFACASCKEKQCDDCKKGWDANKCHFCAAKLWIISHVYCCANCEKAGNEKAAACKKCVEQRAFYEKIECKEKDCPNKKKG
jgi:hypothetical protein